VLEADYLSATRAAYDTVARDYARLLAGALDRMPWDRAVLAMFAELVARDRLGPVVDVGCGPGRITGHLHHLGLDVRRNARSRGLLFQRLLQQAVEGGTLTYNELRKAGRTRPAPPPPVRARMLPPSLELQEAGLPWRGHES